MAELLFGVETEYAVAGVSPGGSIGGERILSQLGELAHRELIQLPDLHSSGGIFLENGSRFYFDCGMHPEICTPECTNPWDVARYIHAGHRILGRLTSLIESAGAPGTEIMCFRNNVDLSGNLTTWGCHESYLHRISADELQPQIIPHLVTRLIYTGAGGFNPFSLGMKFTVSPRVAHLRNVVSGSSTGDRGIFHTREEPLCDGYCRLHILCGESNCSEIATFLKIGTTALIVAMADEGLIPGSAVQLAEPLAAMQEIASDVTCKGLLPMMDGNMMTAIAIQRHYLDLAESRLGASFMPDWAAEVCRRWRVILDQLEGAPRSVGESLDWGIKLALYKKQTSDLGIKWDELPFWNVLIEQIANSLIYQRPPGRAIPLNDALTPNSTLPEEIAFLEPVLQSRGLRGEDLRKFLSCRTKLFEIDTRFGQLGPRGIFEALDAAGVLNHRVSGVDNIEHAMTEPPATGRARIRGQVIKRLAGSGNLRCDWRCIVNREDRQMLDLSDPFMTEELWHPLRPQDFRDEWGSPADADNQGQYARRQEAADCILSGDFSRAEALLRGLLEERFALPSTNCHMARVLLMTDRESEAREQINQAWAIREQANKYVVPRILFFRCLFAIFDGTEINSLVEEIRSELREPGAQLDWTILPMLNYLRSRLGEANFNFLSALAEVLSGAEATSCLDEFPQWRSEALAAD